MVRGVKEWLWSNSLAEPDHWEAGQLPCPGQASSLIILKISDFSFFKIYFYSETRHESVHKIPLNVHKGSKLLASHIRLLILSFRSRFSCTGIPKLQYED
jgi:hypothetical protein